MCSLAEDEILPEEPSSSTTINCRKCNAYGDILLRKNDSYCKACFLAATNHKFRATLGKNKMIKANEDVLVRINGSLESMILFDLVNRNVKEDIHKKLRVNPIFLYINDIAQQKSMERQKFILNNCLENRVDCYIVNLFDEIAINLMPNVIPSFNFDNVSEIYKQGIISETSRKELTTRLYENLTVKVAEHLNINIVFTDEYSMSLACKMLSDVALGRGAQLESEMSFADLHYGNVKVLRPMSDITYEELIHYKQLNNIEHIETFAPSTTKSIQGLMEKFIRNLNDSFPATISTICRTGEKMKDVLHSDPRTESCILCCNKLDTQLNLSSALQATEFSTLVSSGIYEDQTTIITGADTNQKIEIDIDHPSFDHFGLSRSDIEKELCYGCRLIIRDIKDDKMIPKHIINKVKKRHLEPLVGAI